MSFFFFFFFFLFFFFFFFVVVVVVVVVDSKLLLFFVFLYSFVYVWNCIKSKCEGCVSVIICLISPTTQLAIT